MVGGQETRPGRGRDDDQTNKDHNFDQEAASYDSNPDIPEANSQPCPSPANRKSPPNFSAKFRGVNDDDGHTLHNYMCRQMLGEECDVHREWTAAAFTDDEPFK